jgi:hypothetical protein
VQANVCLELTLELTLAAMAPLRGDKACGGAGACSASSGDDFSDCRGGLSSNSIAGWHGMDGDGGNGGEGGD